MPLAYPSRTPLALAPTPLQFLQRTSSDYGHGHRIWVKRDDLTGCALSGNKVRKLEFITAHARAAGCDTLITCGGLQSNHCRATAFVGAQLGLQVHLILRGESSGVPDGNLLLDYLAGAKVSTYPKKDYVEGIDVLFEHWADHYRAQGCSPQLVPTGGSDGIGVWGYIAAAEEIAGQLADKKIDEAHIVTATGSGGTQAGLTLGVALHGIDATVWGVNVCDDEDYFVRKVSADIGDWRSRYPEQPAVDIEPRVLDGYVGRGYAVADPPVFELIARLARTEGLVLDPVYTGKAFAGMLTEIESGRFEGVRDIIFVHTGGIFGVFPQARGFRDIAFPNKD